MKPNTTSQSNPASIACQISLRELRSPPRSLITWRLPHSLLAMGLVLCSAMTAPAQTYTITKLAVPAGTTFDPMIPAMNPSMNNLGQVVGNTNVFTSRTWSAGPAFVWENGTYLSLPPLPSDAAGGVNAISDSGLVVGWSPREHPSQILPHRAVWWRKSGAGYVVGDWNALLLPNFPNYPLLLREASGISHDGQFVAFRATNIVSERLFAAVAQLNHSGEIIAMRSIDTFGNPAVTLLSSKAVNPYFNASTSTVRLAGSGTTQDGVTHRCLWEWDVVTGSITMAERSSPNLFVDVILEDVNGFGEAAGWGIKAGGGTQSCFWHEDGTLQPIPSLGGALSRAASINDDGFVVGWSDRSGRNAARHAFRWDALTGITSDLNSLKSPTDTSGLEIRYAFKINDAGQILGAASKGSAWYTVLLTPQ